MSTGYEAGPLQWMGIRKMSVILGVGDMAPDKDPHKGKYYYPWGQGFGPRKDPHKSKYYLWEGEFSAGLGPSHKYQGHPLTIIYVTPASTPRSYYNLF